MTVLEMARELGMEIIAGSGGADRQVEGCCIGDLLSWMMGKAESGDAWLTVMGNLNAIAVASLKDAACIVLTEGSHLDKDAKARADEQDIAVLSTGESAFKTALRVAPLLPK